MSQQEQYEEDDFQQSGGGWWIKWIGIIVYIAIIVAYAVQTLELVAWLFPADTWFMKTVTVFVCDGCATGYAMAEMFYRFRLRKSKTLVFGMWIVTFVLSTAATVIQMYLSSTHNVPHAIDPMVISIAYGLIIVAFVVNIVAITVVIRMEHGASHPVHRYLDDKPRGRKQPGFPTRQDVQNGAPSIFADHPQGYKASLDQWQAQQPHGTPVSQWKPFSETPERTFTEEQVRQMITESMSNAEQHFYRVRDEKQTSPLAQPPLDTQDSQPGTNGKH